MTEKKWDNLKVCVYPGADGNFVLYEDEGNNYNYENGAYTEIPIDVYKRQDCYRLVACPIFLRGIWPV